MAKQNVTNVSVSGDPDHSMALHWEADGARYHVWVNSNLHGSVSGTIYKNAPLHLKRGDPGHFDARRLNIQVPKNRTMFETAKAVAIQCDMVAKLRADVARQEAETAKKNAEAAALRRVKEAGPELLAALTALRDDVAKLQWGQPYPGRNHAVMDAADAAIARAEGGET